jgi:hypothetical protein
MCNASESWSNSFLSCFRDWSSCSGVGSGISARSGNDVMTTGRAAILNEAFDIRKNGDAAKDARGREPDALIAGRRPITVGKLRRPARGALQLPALRLGEHGIDAGRIGQDRRRSYFEPSGRCSRNTSLIRDCHPGPVARNRSITSGSSRRLTRRFGASNAGRPRPRMRRPRSAALAADAGCIRASRISSSGLASRSASAASVTARSSSSVVLARSSRALARAATRFI